MARSKSAHRRLRCCRTTAATSCISTTRRFSKNSTTLQHGKRTNGTKMSDVGGRMAKLLALAGLCCGALLLSANASAQFVQQGTKLVGLDASPTFVNQGWSVVLSADGNTAIVGGY